VRLALVARSTQTEKDVVTTAAPVWEGSYDTVGNPAAGIVLSGLTDWQKYRYKVFQTTVPLRNLSWMGVLTGC
jgi:type IV pilus assembly protein PilW